MKYRGELRASLLLSIGVGAVACGGSTARSRGDESNGAGGGSNADAGKSAFGGSAMSGGSAAIGGRPSTAGGTSSGGGRARLPTCTAPALDARTGLVKCAEGYVHRQFAATCKGAPLPDVPNDPSYGGDGAGGDGGAASQPEPPADAGAPPVTKPPFENPEDECTRDSDCAQYERGFCDVIGDEAFCNSGCRSDADCRPGYLCECGHDDVPGGGVCLRGNDCILDADCAEGYLCASYTPGCGFPGFACQSPADQCLGQADCQCSWGNEGNFRSCDDSVCGRPFLVEAKSRVAPAVPSSSWNDGQWSPRVDHLAALERRRLAEHFTRLGQMEHASIAAFARFSLQLLALGAPPGLVEACTSALQDETRHAQLCFAIASRYAGHAIGPGPLDISQCLAQSSLLEVVDLVIAEGCVGETSAALEAREAAAGASDPVLRRAFTQIADDEQRHAELAFRFVSWALERDSSGVLARIDVALASSRVRSKSSSDVVVPCLQALRDRALFIFRCEARLET